MEDIMKKIIILSALLSSLSYVSATDYNNSLERLSYLNKKQHRSLEFLYGKWYSPPFRSLLTSGRHSSRIAGKWANSRRSKSYIPKFIHDYSINTQEIAQPLSSFKTFNEFFTRTLKADARPIYRDRATIISPADGNILVMAPIEEQTLFPTKKVMLSLQKMLKDTTLAEQFIGGTAIIVRIAPWDYHRFHFPTDGIAGKPRIISGRFESVSPIVYQSQIQPLEVNERHIIQLHSDTASTIAIVLVGALFVGAIRETYRAGGHYHQGNEMGYFEYGGSTVVLLFQKDVITILPQIVAASAQGVETPVKIGHVIGYVRTP